MKVIAVYVLAGLLIFAGASSADCDYYVHGVSVHNGGAFEDMSFDLEDGSIIMTRTVGRRVETVEITEDYELYINGDYVKLDADQQKLVQEFYDRGMEIVEYAKELGWEGARIGVSGAKLGLKAVGNVFRLLFTGYDTDDFEREMERAAAKIEARAERLEEKAEKVEDMVEELEDISWAMDREIPELRELDWF